MPGIMFQLQERYSCLFYWHRFVVVSSCSWLQSLLCIGFVIIVQDVSRV